MKYYKTFKEFLKKRRRYLVQGGVATPHLSWYPEYHGCVSLKKLAPGFGFEFIAVICFDQGDRMNWVFDADEFWRKGEALMRRPTILKRLYRLWRVREIAFSRHIGAMARRDIKNNLLAEYVKFSEIYAAEYTPALVTEYFTVWGQRFVQELLKTHRAPDRVAEDITVLTSPPRLSFMQKEECSLLTIAHAYKDRGKFTPTIRRALARHAQEYFWLQNNYKRTDPLPVSYFEKCLRGVVSAQSERAITARLKKLTRYEVDMVLRKRQVRVTTKISRADQKKLDWLGFIAAWQDRRKQANLIANYWLNELMKLGASQLGVSLLACQFLLPDEFVRALKRKRFPGRMVQERLKGCTHIQLQGGTSGMITGKDHERAVRIFLALQGKESAILKGLGVSAGFVRGKVYKVEDPSKEGRTFPKGAILVTYMTRPDFLPLMQHAKAIVTDEGGVTSHAAIVARELKIPCVVGTRVAMRVLKDGDRVEVDAERGIVKKL